MPERKGTGVHHLGLLICGQVSLHAAMAGVRMAAPLHALKLGYSEAAVGAMLALFALSPMFLSIPAGRWVDRIGTRRSMTFAALAAAVGTTLTVIWPGFASLCVAAFLNGAATGIISMTVQRHVGRAAASAVELRRAFSWVSLGPAISNFIGPFAAGWVIDLAGFAWAFAMLAVFPVLTWFWIRPVRDLTKPEASGAPGHRRAFDLLRHGPFRRLLLVNWVMASCWDVHTFIVPVLGHERGLSASAIGSILGAFALAAAAVRVVLPMLAARLDERKVVGCAMLGTALVFAVYPFAHQAWMMGLCSAFLGLSLGCNQPMLMSLLHHLTPAARHGDAIALRMSAINASSVATPLFFGLAGAVIGASGVFWTLALLGVITSRTAFRLGQK